MSREGSSGFQEDDRHPLPATHAPTPHPSSPYGADSLLTLTPEKATHLGRLANHDVNNIRSAKQLAKQKGQSKQKGHVHFSETEVNLTDDQIGKHVYIHITDTRAGKASTKSTNHRPPKKSQATNHRPSVKSLCLQNKNTTENCYNHQVCSKTTPLGIASPPSGLASPALHSSEMLSYKLTNIQQEKFDAENAVLKTLQESDKIRNDFVERIAEVVNVPKNYKKYSGLVSIDIPVEATVDNAVEEKLSKVSKVRPKSKISNSRQPDIMECFVPNMLTDSIDLAPANPISLTVKTHLVPVESTFDIYRHMQKWQT